MSKQHRYFLAVSLLFFLSGCGGGSNSSTSTPSPSSTSITVKWDPPTLNADGSQLNDLAGYRIKWGSQSGVHTNLFQVNDPDLDQFTVDNLPQGDYFLVISAFDSADNESLESNEVNAVVD